MEKPGSDFGDVVPQSQLVVTVFHFYERFNMDTHAPQSLDSAESTNFIQNKRNLYFYQLQATPRQRIIGW